MSRKLAAVAIVCVAFGFAAGWLGRQPVPTGPSGRPDVGYMSVNQPSATHGSGRSTSRLKTVPQSSLPRRKDEDYLEVPPDVWVVTIDKQTYYLICAD